MSDQRLLNTYDVFEYKTIIEDRPPILKEVNGKEVEVPGGKKVLMKGILQKADTLNQNGRIYPIHILEREVRNYQKFIIENRALGEIDHPDCVGEGYFWLSETGWCPIEDVKPGMKAATIDEKGNLVYQLVERGVHQPYVGHMISITNKKGTINQLLTPNHRILLWDRNNKPYYITAKEFHEGVQRKDSHISHSCFKRSANWYGNDQKTIEVAGHVINAELWAAFLGIYLAEGHSNGIMSGVEKRRPSHRGICISQKKSDTRDRIKQLLDQLPWKVKEINQGYTIHDNKLYSHLFALGSSHTKYIPQYAKNWSPRLLKVMLEWMLLGDGRNRYGYKKECIISEYCTTSNKLAEDTQEIMFKLGYGATIHTYQPQDRKSPDYKSTGRMILTENSAPMNIVYQHSSQTISSDTRFVKTELVNYDGTVHCMTTPNGNWLAKSPSGQMFWTGNSSVVNLKNVSHIIREAHLESGTVVGTVEVLDTPSGKILQSLVESGVKLGISSRGVGSTRKQGDYYVVQDDFQLICWDYVSEPSTPGAFMIPEGRRLSEGEVDRIFNKSDRIDRVLNDILSNKR